MFNCFKKKKIVVSEGYGEKPVSRYTFGIIIPHTDKHPGATSFGESISEYDYAFEMIQTLGNEYDTRDKDGVSGAARSLIKRDCNASIETHFNAYNQKAYGAEMLVLKNDSESIEVARLIMEDFKEYFPGRKLRGDRGLKLLSKGDRGSYNLIAAKNQGMKVALLSELFFGDNESDWMKPSIQAEFWKRHI